MRERGENVKNFKSFKISGRTTPDRILFIIQGKRGPAAPCCDFAPQGDSDRQRRGLCTAMLRSNGGNFPTFPRNKNATLPVRAPRALWTLNGLKKHGFWIPTCDHELSRPTRVSWLQASGTMCAPSLPVSYSGVQEDPFMDAASRFSWSCPLPCTMGLRGVCEEYPRRFSLGSEPCLRRKLWSCSP